MSPTFQNFPARFVVGVGGNFISILSPEGNNFVVIPRLWEVFCERRGEISQVKDADVSLGCVRVFDVQSCQLRTI